MTYQTPTAPASFGGTVHSLLASVGGFFRTLGRAIEVNSTAQKRLDTVRRLQRKTDVELAAIGVKREDIVHHVFKDLYYI